MENTEDTMKNVKLKFTSTTIDRVNSLVEMTGETNRTIILSAAVRLMKGLLEEQEKGHKIQIVKKYTVEHIEIKL
jgi:hypothetical protein